MGNSETFLSGHFFLSKLVFKASVLAAAGVGFVQSRGAPTDTDQTSAKTDTVHRIHNSIVQTCLAAQPTQEIEMRFFLRR